MFYKIKTYMIFLWEDFYLLKLAFTAFTLFLLFDECNVFLFTKPTSTSMEERHLEPDNPLDILVCLKPGFDTDGLNRNGYANPYWFFLGINRSRSL